MSKHSDFVLYHTQPQQPTSMLRARPFRTLLLILVCTFFVFSYYWRSVLPADAQTAITQEVDSIRSSLHLKQDGKGAETVLKVAEEGGAKNKVPLEVHIMSKCPDARTCLQELVVPTMAKVASEVDFKISFIGTATDSDDGVECKHGPTECLGNILILCAEKQYSDPKQYLGFANCLITRFTEIPQRELVSDCALDFGISMEKLNDCASDSTDGMQLLRKSVTHSKEVDAGISCTVRLDEKKWCVVDGGVWKECEGGHGVDDLVKAIDGLAKKEKDEH